MSCFPKGLQVLLLDLTSDGEAARALGSHDFAYRVTTVTSLAAAQAQLSGVAAAYDCVVAEHAIVSSAPAVEATAFFRAAAAPNTPVVLMGEQPSQATVLQGVRWGAVDFLHRPLSLAKLRNLWQHKIRKMMVLGNGGTVPRRLSLPLLPSSSNATGGDSARSAAPPGDSALSGASARGADPLVMPRTASLPGLSCPDTPSLHTASLGAPQPSSSAGSGGSGSGGSGSSSGFQMQQPSRLQPARAGDCSDATSGVPRVQPAGAAVVPAGPPAPLACVQLGAAGEALPAAVLHWPALPAGTAWGTPVGCGVLPPLPAAQAHAQQASPGAAAAFPPPSIRWCSPGSLPVPASSYELLLPEDFSLARTAAEAGTNGPASGGPLRLKLTITPELLAGLNSALQA